MQIELGSLNVVEMELNEKRKRVVGRRKDGSLTDDISEITINGLQVEEMSIEEFILQSKNAVEEAEKTNENLKNMLFDKTVEIMKKVVKHLPKNFELEKMDRKQ